MNNGLSGDGPRAPERSGGLARDALFVKGVGDRVSCIAVVFVYLDENEMLTLRNAALRVPAGEEVAASVVG